MALSVDYLYTYSRDLMKKNQAGGLKSTLFTSLWNGESSSYMSDLLGRFQRINNGKGGMQTGLIENETILQKLSPFTTNNPALAVTTGNATKPSGLIYRLAVRVGGVNAIKINQDQIATINADVLGDAPSIANGKYYYVEYLDKYTIFPIAVTAIELDYITAPIDIVWGYTFDGNGRQVYSAGTSEQPLWDNLSCREITERMMKKLGVSFKDKDFENFGNGVVNTGN